MRGKNQMGDGAVGSRMIQKLRTKPEIELAVSLSCSRDFIGSPFFALEPGCLDLEKKVGSKACGRLEVELQAFSEPPEHRAFHFELPLRSLTSPLK